MKKELFAGVLLLVLIGLCAWNLRYLSRMCTQLDEAAAQARAASLGLSGLDGRHPYDLSGGQRQRIMLAVAALLNKPLIVIDEPTSALDTGSTDKVLAFFRRQAEKGAAVLAVSHDKDFASGCHYLIEL